VGRHSASKKNKRLQCNVLLGLGVHAIEYEGKKIIILHHAVGDPQSSQAGVTIYRELVLFVEGVKNYELLKKFCTALLSQEQKTHDKVVSIYRWMSSKGFGGGFWKKSCMKMARPLESVVLPVKLKKQLIDDMQQFLAETTERFYFTHGIPYKRSYLLHGSPGSGKSSLIMAIAGYFKRNLCLMQPATPDMTDQSFSACVSSCPRDSIIVLEDIDALFDHNRKKKEASYLTFSGILNALDGIASPTAQIFILTTNHPERLDPALIRSGRVDMHLYFPKATKEQLRKIYLNFYPEENELAEKFSALVLGAFPSSLSMASIQNHFIRNMCKSAESPLNIDGLQKQVNASRETASNGTENMFF